MRPLKNFLKVPKNDKVLVILKPGFSHLMSTVCNMFIQHEYKITYTRTKQLLLSEAKDLYKVHKKEKFYKSLCEYMSSDITTAFILEKDSKNIYKEFAKLKDEIREKYGESDMRNVLHSSDSYESFVHESGVYFFIPNL